MDNFARGTPIEHSECPLPLVNSLGGPPTRTLLLLGYESQLCKLGNVRVCGRVLNAYSYSAIQTAEASDLREL